MLTDEQREDFIRENIANAIEELERAAEELRGPGLPPSPHRMSVEIAVTKALDALYGNPL